MLSAAHHPFGLLRHRFRGTDTPIASSTSSSSDFSSSGSVDDRPVLKMMLVGLGLLRRLCGSHVAPTETSGSLVSDDTPHIHKHILQAMLYTPYIQGTVCDHIYVPLHPRYPAVARCFLS